MQPGGGQRLRIVGDGAHDAGHLAEVDAIGFVRVFALLVLVDLAGELHRFIDERFHGARARFAGHGINAFALLRVPMPSSFSCPSTPSLTASFENSDTVGRTIGAWLYDPSKRCRTSKCRRTVRASNSFSPITL